MEPRERISLGVAAWNKWRDENPSFAWGEYDLTHLCAPASKRLPICRPDLSFVDLSGQDLATANLEGCILHGAKLSRANLSSCCLDHADLSRAEMEGAILHRAHGTHVTFYRANLMGADLRESNFRLSDFEHVRLNDANLTQARLVDSLIYGTAAWGVKTNGAVQSGLHLTRCELRDAGLIDTWFSPLNRNAATVDDLMLASLLHFLVLSDSPRELLGSLSSRIVLILGRFSTERKRAIDRIREVLKTTRFCPVMFDFEKPANRTFTETVSSLAHLSSFIIADLTDAKIVIQELHRTVPMLPSVPVVPVICGDSEANVIATELQAYPWFLPLIRYDMGTIDVVADQAIAAAEDYRKHARRGLQH
jgi:uncharacterized protein YjbI with pentapeptide repeats